MSGDQKIKTAAGKVPLNLLPMRVLKGVARVFGYGAKKYAKGNWYTATDDEFGDRYVGGGFRHIADCQRLDGTFDFESMAKLDDESGLPEIDHAICGLIMFRGLLIKRGLLPEDPGVGNDPIAKLESLEHDETTCSCRDCETFRMTTVVALPVVHDMVSGRCPDGPHTHAWNVPLSDRSSPGIDTLTVDNRTPEVSW